ncbi:MAG: hypothetical protein M3N59_00315 [bacterium]|nr:hypothetical protein [bacterium]
MKFSRKQVAIAVGLVLTSLLIVVFVSSRENSSNPAAPSPSPTLIPSSDIEKVEARDLPFQVDLPSVTTKGRLVFATYRRTALGSMDVTGENFAALTPQEFLYIEQVSWSPDGSRAVIKAHGNRTALLRDGKLSEINKEIRNVEWAPDNRRFAYTYGKTNLPHVFNSDTRTFRRLANKPLGSAFAWSPDGSRIATYEKADVSTDGGTLRIVEVGSGELVETGATNVISSRWNNESKRMAITQVKNSLPVLGILDPGSGKTQETKLPGFADKGAWLSGETFLVASAESVETDYLTNPKPVADRLWRIDSEGSVVELAAFDDEVRTARLLGQKLILVTDTEIIRVDITDTKSDNA